MKKYRFLLAIVMMILIAFSLTACVQKASTPPPSEGNFPVPEGTQQPMDILSEAATQTAIALNAGPEEPTPEGGAPAAEEGAPADETQPADTTAVAEQPAEPTATPLPPSEVPTFEVPEKYVLQAGEFPFCIARRFNVDIAALLNASGLSMNSTVHPGTTLTIPKGAASFTGERARQAHPTQYSVQAGDTIYSIACLFGDVDPRAIEAVNNLTAGYTLSAGQVIQIP